MIQFAVEGLTLLKDVIKGDAKLQAIWKAFASLETLQVGNDCLTGEGRYIPLRLSLKREGNESSAKFCMQ